MKFFILKIATQQANMQKTRVSANSRPPAAEAAGWSPVLLVGLGMINKNYFMVVASSAANGAAVPNMKKSEEEEKQYSCICNPIASCSLSSQTLKCIK